jgi:hypothetical protein
MRFRVAYLQEKKVLIPIKASLNDNDALYDFETLDKLAYKGCPPIIDPRSISRYDLKRICEESKIPLGLVWGYEPLPQLKALVDNSGYGIPLNIVLESYFDSLSSIATENTYRRGIRDIFTSKILSEECTLNEFINNFPNIMQIIEGGSFLKNKRFAKNALSSFRSYINKELKAPLCKGRELVDPDRKINEGEASPLSVQQWEAFITVLRKRNPRDALVAEILQLSNGPIFAPLPQHLLEEYEQIGKESICQAKNICGPEAIVLKPEKIRKDKPAKGTPLVSLKMVLEMHLYQILSHENCLRFERRHCGRRIIQCYPFPRHIFSGLSKLMKPDSHLVFSTSEGAPVHESQLKRNFSKASEQAGFSKAVSPKIVRIPIPGLVYCPFCQRPKWKKGCVCMWHVID